MVKANHHLHIAAIGKNQHKNSRKLKLIAKATWINYTTPHTYTHQYFNFNSLLPLTRRFLLRPQQIFVVYKMFCSLSSTINIYEWAHLSHFTQATLFGWFPINETWFRPANDEKISEIIPSINIMLETMGTLNLTQK